MNGRETNKAPRHNDEVGGKLKQGKEASPTAVVRADWRLRRSAALWLGPHPVELPCPGRRLPIEPACFRRGNYRVWIAHVELHFFAAPSRDAEPDVRYNQKTQARESAANTIGAGLAGEVPSRLTAREFVLPRSGRGRRKS
jgi:hypothetical protein